MGNTHGETEQFPAFYPQHNEATTVHNVFGTVQRSGREELVDSNTEKRKQKY